jgi:choline dehydrogenase
MLVPRGKVTGGSSAINGEIFLRGLPEDFDAWAALGNAEWSFQKVLPFFCRLERDLDFRADFHGAEGPIPVRRFQREEWLLPQVAFYEACGAAGFPESPDHNDPNVSGVGPIPLNTLDGVRWSTNVGYLNPARHRPNLILMPDCLVHRVLFDGNRATGVVLGNGGTTIYGEEIILSAGAIGSPHLLMLSGVGPADQLRSAGVPLKLDLPGVGQNLCDHPHVYALWRWQPDFSIDPDRPRYQVALRYTTPGSHLRNDMQILMVSFATGRVDRGGDGRTPEGIVLQPVLNLALSKGELRLQSSDPTLQPALDFNLLSDPFDRRRLREALHLCVRLVQHSAFEAILGPRIAPTDEVMASDDAMDEWMMGEVSTTNHISGTCKMGPASDPTAVVDQYGWVRGLEGIRVADASIMPDCVRANTNATTMMIGERMAGLIMRGD